jgi:lipid-A-disaccharide synthase
LNLPWLLKAAEKVRERVPNVRFAIASFKLTQSDIARQLLTESNIAAEIHVNRTPELIHAATCCMAVSGSVSLELLYHTKPSVILYHISRLAFRVQNKFRKVRYITLVNLITAPELVPSNGGLYYDPLDPADAHVLMPEYVTCEDRSGELAQHVVTWLLDPTARERRIAELAALKQRLAHGGASRRAADYILGTLAGEDAGQAKRSAA